MKRRRSGHGHQEPKLAFRDSKLGDERLVIHSRALALSNGLDGQGLPGVLGMFLIEAPQRPPSTRPSDVEDRLFAQAVEDLEAAVGTSPKEAGTDRRAR